MLSTFAVINTADSGVGSLRQAILDANASVGADSIVFNIPIIDPNFVDVDSALAGGDAAADAYVITPLSALPSLNDTTGGTTIDGRTQTTFGGDTNPFGPEIILDGSSAGAGAHGLHIDGSDNNQIFGLNIQQFERSGILIDGGGNNLFAGNYIGTDATGTLDRGNTSAGLNFQAATPNNIVGGAAAADRNVISGNDDDGIVFAIGSDGNHVLGNYIGTDATGTSDLGNKNTGVQLSSGSDNNIIGGTTAAERNIISGNNSNGVAIRFFATDNIIAGNYIGTDVTGNVDLGNSLHGVRISNGAFGNTIGGSTIGAGNVISGNDLNGIWITDAPNLRTGDNVVQGNFIGTNTAGTTALGNALNGVLIEDGATDNLIGTDADGVNDTAERNIISGNALAGLRFTDTTTGVNESKGNIVAGNFIGTDVTGTAAIPNSVGVELVNAGGTIGGDDASAGNLISGNNGDGINQSGLGSEYPDDTRNWWKGDGDGKNFVRNSQNLILNGDTTFAAGKSDQAFSFDGDNDSAFTAANVTFLEFTVDAWVNPTSIGSTQSIISQIGTENDEGQFQFRLDPTGKVEFIRRTGVSTATDAFLTDAAITSGVWTHVAAVFAGGSDLKIYINGVEQTGTLTLGDSYTALAAAQTIVGLADGDQFDFGGLIDEPAIYFRALTAKEIQAIYNIDGPAKRGTVIQDNLIGTDVTGTLDLGNTGHGIDISESPGNVIGGTTAAERNIISGNDLNGILITGAGSIGNSVQGNYIGTDATGKQFRANGSDGVWITDGSTQNVIGGSTPNDRNIISGNDANGVRITGTGTDNNVVIGNYIGTDVDGEFARRNLGSGVFIGSHARNNTIGTDGDGVGDAAEGNVLSGNSDRGVRIETAHDNVVAGNLIGTDATGTRALANANDGVLIWAGSTGNRIGTDGDGSGDVAERNLISGNRLDGVRIGGSRPGNNTDNIIAGNYIGTDVTGTLDLGNTMHGIDIVESPGNVIGGTTAAERNIISGNNLNGILITGAGSAGNVVQGNRVGTDASGTVDLGNVGAGVAVVSGPSNTMIGGTAAGVGNLISGNDDDGVSLFGSDGNFIQGNLVGTDVTGTIDLGNRQTGVHINAGSDNNIVGGPSAAARNVISGNNSNGVAIRQFSSNNVVQGNYIGVDVGGTANLGNGANGVWVAIASLNNTIGGSPAEANTIAFNQRGVVVGRGSHTTSGNRIQANSIHSNTELGIDLVALQTPSVFGDGVTPNDPGDADTGGNELQNFPLITTAEAGATTRVAGTLNSLANTTFTIDFYANSVADPSGHGEGERYLGSTTVLSNGSGDASFDVFVAAATTGGEFITATATDPAGNTSEFSAVIAAMVNYNFTASAFSSVEGDVTNTTNVVMLTRNEDSTAETVDVVLTGGTATAGDDFTAGPITVSFNVGQSTKAVPIELLGDISVEPDETINLSLTNFSGNGKAGSTNPTSTLSIDNDDFFTGRVFDDLDNDGVFEPSDGDAGIGGVTMQLVNQTSGLVVNTEITAADGTYTFTVTVASGTYKIVEVVDELVDLGLLDGKETAGVNGGTVDNSQDSNEITNIAVGAAGPAAPDVEYLFAEIRPSDIYGSVWSDFNNDGQINFGELGINGVSVSLSGSDDRGNPVNLNDTTVLDGSYVFIDLRPGTYMIEETQPAGFDDGLESLGQVTDLGVATAVGDDGFIDGNDKFSGIVLVPGSEGDMYNFGERLQAGGEIGDSTTATIGFWHNKNGQELIQSLNGSASSTQLGDWLAATFPEMYGSGAFYDAAKGADQDMNLAGKTNTEVGEIFKYLHKRNKKTAVAGGPPKMDAQVMALALSTYVTSETLAGGSVAAAYGFNTSTGGIGYNTFNVLSVLTSQEATDLGLNPDANGHVTIIDILLATNSLGADGLLYDTDDNDSIDAFELSLRKLANDLYSAINEGSDI